MSGRVKIKTIIIIVIVVLVGVLGLLGVRTARTYLSSAAGGVEPQNVTAKVNEDGRGAVVSWISEKESMGVVEYGTTPASLLLRAVESEQVTNHRVSLAPLKANVTYYFRIRIGDEIYDNEGIPYSFKTLAEISPSPSPTPMVTLVPTVPVVETCNKTTDYNGDGVVNSLDYLDCLKGEKLPGSQMTPTADECRGYDYDQNGVINSLDRLKCLQDKGL